MNRNVQDLLCLTDGIVLKLDVASVEPHQHMLTLLNDILSTDLQSIGLNASRSPIA
jgi:hypothetical protein